MKPSRSNIDLDFYSRAELTYAEHGATLRTPPPGYFYMDRRERIGAGPDVFLKAKEALIGWGMHRGAGLVVLAKTPTAELGSVVVMRLGPSILGIVAPCRVVGVVDEPGQGGFAYGTLPGHPESGEEAFVVQLSNDGEVYLRVRAFSRPASPIARAGGPLTRVIQRLITDRYVGALRQLSQR